RNQATEIETLNKELASMRKNIEQFNVEHSLRQAPAAKEEKAPAKKAKAEKPAKKAATKKATKK
ncbi:MAG: hypothetical protein K2L99_02285, partial [Muribaculaceae bacterium]|nr:hypothetical protein [Muribaculaceae bacterium]